MRTFIYTVLFAWCAAILWGALLHWRGQRRERRNRKRQFTAQQIRGMIK